MKDYPIDFVIAWVDGSDKEWLNEKSKYTGGSDRLIEADSRELRYKDLGTLKYWFRGVEKYAPWVRKIHFVTWGHVPEWLDITNPKLNIVKHSDFIPDEYLPTFSSHTIELNFHRIKDLAEHFVYFNDDMFLVSKVKEEDFFYKGLPKDVAAINAKWFVMGDTPAFVQIQDTAVINKHFEKNSVIKRNFFKWFNFKYRELNLRTLALMAWPRFIVLHTMHLPSSLCKSTYDTLWDKEYELLHNTCSHKIRNYLDVNQWLIQFWQICSGKFVPASVKRGKGFVIGENAKQNADACKAIKSGKYKLICVGEGDYIVDVEKTVLEIQRSFEEILPERSSYER